MSTSGICILAPHCDDALLAVGGLILLQDNVHVIDVFATTAWTTLSEVMTTEAITVMNQSEEKRAIYAAGATLKLIETPEALMRGYGEWNNPKLKASDYKLAEELWLKLSTDLAKYSKIYFPIAVGGHVDHRIVQRIILNHFADLNPETELYCFEDLPYSWYGGLDEALASIRADFALTKVEYDIGAVFEHKLMLLAGYPSQLSGDDLDKVREYALRIGNGQAKERVWQLHLH